MKNLKHTLLGVAALGVVGATTAQAQSVLFMGGTTGCFYTGSVACVPPSTANLIFNQLIFRPGTFAQGIPLATPTNPTSGLGSTNNGGVLTGTTPGNTLGSLELVPENVTNDYTGEKLLLNITFSAPSVTGTQIYTANIVGQVLQNLPPGGNTPNGGLTVSFGPAQTFQFIDPANGNAGSFTLSVNTLSVSADPCLSNAYNATTDVCTNAQRGYSPITGTISVTETPEPASLALLGTGLLGLIPVVRRRRAAK